MALRLFWMVIMMKRNKPDSFRKHLKLGETLAKRRKRRKVSRQLKNKIK